MALFCHLDLLETLENNSLDIVLSGLVIRAPPVCLHLYWHEITQKYIDFHYQIYNQALF